MSRAGQCLTYVLLFLAQYHQSFVLFAGGCSCSFGIAIEVLHISRESAINRTSEVRERCNLAVAAQLPAIVP